MTVDVSKLIQRPLQSPVKVGQSKSHLLSISISDKPVSISFYEQGINSIRLDVPNELLLAGCSRIQVAVGFKL